LTLIDCADCELTDVVEQQGDLGAVLHGGDEEICE